MGLFERQLAVFFADFDLIFFSRPTNFVSVGPSYNSFCVGDRFLSWNRRWIEQPSIIVRLSTDRFTHLEFSYKSADTHRSTTENRTRVDCFFFINWLMNDRPYTGYVKHLTYLAWWAVARRTMSYFRLFSSINWSNARVVTVKYSAIAKLFMQLVARKNVVQRSMIERLLVFTANK